MYMYNIFIESIYFEWDDEKNQSNKLKHEVSFEEAATVFYDDYAFIALDPDHSIEEERFLINGESRIGNHLVVSYCYRGRAENIRIISARRATKKEKLFYLNRL